MHRGTVIGLVTTALFAGMLAGPPLAHAATTTIVNIEGGSNTNKANVTKAGQLETTQADAANAVAVLGTLSCDEGGFYVVPTGKALIITSVNFYNHLTGGADSEADLTAGASADPCANVVAAGVSPGTASMNEVFQPGIPIAAGDALGGVVINDAGTVEVYGYLVPKADVPADALHSVRSIRAGRSATIESGK